MLSLVGECRWVLRGKEMGSGVMQCNAQNRQSRATAISSIAAVNQQVCLCIPPTDFDGVGRNRSGLRLPRWRHSCHFAVTEGGSAGGSAFICVQIMTLTGHGWECDA